MEAEGLETLSQLQDRVLHDPATMEQLLLDLSINVTAMFRDPGFYLAFREQVVPLLRTYPFIRIWHAGCSTGEEVYSMAILLHEEGLLDRARIYATDMNEAVLDRARSGIFPLDHMKEHTSNYVRAGGAAAFSDYYIAKYDGVMFDRKLRDNIVFARHNLVQDGPFNEFHVVICRNVMIYFAQELQDHVHDLFHESLVRRGVLALGARESIRFTKREGDYDTLDKAWKLYRRRT
jgi:chemotaxis protein methyltransferase CheR